VILPFNFIPGFDGLGTMEERMKWWDKFQYFSESSMWTSEEKCHQLPRLLEQSARAWLKQLALSTQRNWKELSTRFVKQFCMASDSAMEYYLGMTQKTGERSLLFCGV